MKSNGFSTRLNDEKEIVPDFKNDGDTDLLKVQDCRVSHPKWENNSNGFQDLKHMYFLWLNVLNSQVSNWFCWINHYNSISYALIEYLKMFSETPLKILYPNFCLHAVKPEVESSNSCEPEMTTENKEFHQKSMNTLRCREPAWNLWVNFFLHDCSRKTNMRLHPP